MEGLTKMADERVWFITGAGRGMGVHIAQAALGAGHAVVATGRNTEAVADAVGEADDLLVVSCGIGRASAPERPRPHLSRFSPSGSLPKGRIRTVRPQELR